VEHIQWNLIIRNTFGIKKSGVTCDQFIIKTTSGFWKRVFIVREILFMDGYDIGSTVWLFELNVCRIMHILCVVWSCFIHVIVLFNRYWYFEHPEIAYTYIGTAIYQHNFKERRYMIWDNARFSISYCIYQAGLDIV